MSRDINQNLYAEQIITESPFYYDEHGRLRVRVLQEEMDEQEKKLRAEFDEKERGVMRTADMYTDPETGESMSRREKAYRDFKKEKLGGGAKPPASEKKADDAAAPPKETAEPVDIVKSPTRDRYLRDANDQPAPEKKADGAAATTEKQPLSPLQRAREKMKDQLRRGKPGGGSNINKKPVRPGMPPKKGGPVRPYMPDPDMPPKKGGPVRPYMPTDPPKKGEPVRPYMPNPGRPRPIRPYMPDPDMPPRKVKPMPARGSNGDRKELEIGKVGNLQAFKARNAAQNEKLRAELGEEGYRKFIEKAKSEVGKKRPM